MHTTDIRSQQGSVSPVFVALMLFALTLLIAIVDREWLNYNLKLAEEMADFAAEAGTRNHEVYTTIEVTRHYYHYVRLDPDCVQDPLTGIETCTDPSYWAFGTNTIDVRDREEALVQNWKEKARCGNPYQEEPREYACVAVEVKERWVTLPPAAMEIAREVFTANWQQEQSSTAASVVGLQVTPYYDTQDRARSLQVAVTLRLRSLFGLIQWSETPTVKGRAIVTLDPLTITP